MKVQPRLFREARASGWLFPLAVLSAFLAGGLAIYQSHLISRIIAGVFLDAKTLSQVRSLLLAALLVVTSRAVFTFFNEVLSGSLAVKVKTRLRQQLLEKINRLGPEYLKNETTAELTTTALLGVDALDAYFSQFLPQVLIAAVLPVTILVVVFPLDLLTGLVFLITAPLIPLFMVLIGKAVEALTGKQWKGLTQLGNYFLDTLQGISTLKLLGRNKERVSEVRQVSDRYREITLNVLRVTFLTALVLELVATLSTAVVAVEIGIRLLYSRIDFQQAFFILLIAPDFYFPLRQLSARYHAGMSGITAAEKIFQLFDAPESVNHITRTPQQLADTFAGEFSLSVRKVSHAYVGQHTNAIHDLTLDIVKGQHYALVGKSGAGKSTLARILLRFIEPDAGDLLLDGMDIRGWAQEDWRRYVGWLPQSPYIFNESLLFNVTLGETRFTKSEIDQALETANLTSLVSLLPQGLETPLLESGFRLSGGELQRIALARVYLRAPEIIVLDEPTAHLDPHSQQILEDSLHRLMKGRTSLTIAHRLPTVLRSDEVLFLQAGRLVAQGSHTFLLQSSESYSEFIRGGGVGE